MIERLNNSTADKISKKSKAFCEQIDKVQNEYIQEKKDKKAQKSKVDKENSKSDAQSPNLENSSQNDEERLPGEDNDADSSFYSVLYGQNSSLDPDNFI